MNHYDDAWLEAYYSRTGIKPPEDDVSRARARKSPIPPLRGVLPHCGGEALSEEEEQILLFQWAGYMMGTYPELKWMFHIGNGGYRSAAEAGRFKAMGVKPGVSDVFLSVPRGGYHGLYIEMKRADGGQLSDDQREWLEDMSLCGYRAVMCHGWEAARDVLIDYLRR